MGSDRHDTCNCIGMETTNRSAETSRPRVLFVDDSKLMRLSGQKILSERFDVTLAENAEQARAQLDQDPGIQLMFCDLNMPGQSGYELLAELRGCHDPRLSRLPIIIVTGTDNQEAERQRALSLGATDFIIKPFRASELTARAQAHATHEVASRRLRQLEDVHHLDAETGLGNRRYCVQRLDQALSFARRHAQALSLIHLKISGLSALLDEMGQPFAGSALKRIGRVLAEPIRREDTVYRTGPETFSFILPATDASGAEVLRKRFIPDLQALGLVSEECMLQVQCRFSTQTPDPTLGQSAEAILLKGLASESRPAHQPDEAAAEQAPDIEQALQMLRRGEIERLRPHLAGLIDRLQPLLDLAAMDSAPGPWSLAGND
jgi:two-component system, cell cycle response regulator